MKSIPSTQGSGGRGGRQVPLVQCQDHADSFLFELSEVRGTDIATTVAFVPCTSRAVWHLKLIVKEERERWILQGEKQKSWALEWCLEYLQGNIRTKIHTHALHTNTLCALSLKAKHVGMVKAGTKGRFQTSSLLFSLHDLLLCTSTL